MKKMTHTNLGFALRIERLLWLLVYFLFFRFSPNILFVYRIWLLRLFGAKIAAGAHIYPNCSIWLPRNLVMHANSCIGPRTIIYNVSLIEIGQNAIVSQGCHLCTASHDFEGDFGLISAPIYIGDNAWVSTDCFVAPGVTVGTNAVAYARTVIHRNLDPYTIYTSSNLKKVRERK